MEYKVTWIIEVSAESFEEAAQLAREIQLDKESLATHFTVTDENGMTQEIDLEQRKNGL